MTAFAVLDFETTGLDTAHDRIIEIGVVVIDPVQGILGEFETLVNPGRLPGATHIHGISSRHLNNAPTFEVVAQHLSDFLHGNFLVAHNNRYDINILQAEFERLNLSFPVSLNETICTMTVGRTLGLTGNLAAMYEAKNLGKFIDSHRALNDAKAAAELLLAFGQTYPSAKAWDTRKIYDTPPTSRPVFVTRDNYLQVEAYAPKPSHALVIENDTILNLEMGDEIVLTSDRSADSVTAGQVFAGKVRSLGLTFNESLRKATSVLVTADRYSTSTKVQNAVKLGVPIIALEDWVKALESGRIVIQRRATLEDVPDDKVRQALAEYLTNPERVKLITSDLNSRFGVNGSDAEVTALVERFLN